MISNNVMKLKEFKESVYYRVGCDCMEPSCDLTMEFEFDEDCKDILFLNFHQDLVWDPYYHHEYMIVRFWRRIKCSLRMLFKGRVEVQGGLVMRKEHMKGLQEAIKEGIEKMEDKCK